MKIEGDNVYAAEAFDQYIDSLDAKDRREVLKPLTKTTVVVREKTKKELENQQRKPFLVLDTGTVLQLVLIPFVLVLYLLAFVLIGIGHLTKLVGEFLLRELRKV